MKRINNYIELLVILHSMILSWNDRNDNKKFRILTDSECSLNRIRKS